MLTSNIFRIYMIKIKNLILKKNITWILFVTKDNKYGEGEFNSFPTGLLPHKSTSVNGLTAETRRQSDPHCISFL